MADNKDEIPPIPPAPEGTAGAVPPVESAPAAPTESAYGAPTPQAPPVVNQPYPAQQPYANQSGYTYAPQPSEPNGLSITSMVLGIAGLFFGLLVSIAAVITGHMGQKSQPAAKPFWLTGLITGYIGIGLGVLVTIGIILWFAFFFAVVSSTSYYG